MWILNWLPNVFFHMMLLISILLVVAGFTLASLPVIRQYKLPIQIIGILGLAFSLWFQGAIAKEKEWLARVKEVEAKLAEAEARAAQKTVEIVTKVVTHTRVIRERGQEVVRYVDREIVKLDNTCPMPTPVVVAHNAAATNNPDLVTIALDPQGPIPISTPLLPLSEQPTEIKKVPMAPKK
jgi:type II secretory pathway pseudopilin PulG